MQDFLNFFLFVQVLMVVSIMLKENQRPGMTIPHAFIHEGDRFAEFHIKVYQCLMSTDAILKPLWRLHINKTQQNLIKQRVSVLKDLVTAEMKNWRFFMQFWGITA